MDKDRHDWRTLPSPLRLALGLTPVQVIAPVVFESGVGLAWGALANLGAEATANALYAYGALELAQRHTGARR